MASVDIFLWFKTEKNTSKIKKYRWSFKAKVVVGNASPTLAVTSLLIQKQLRCWEPQTHSLQRHRPFWEVCPRDPSWAEPSSRCPSCRDPCLTCGRLCLGRPSTRRLSLRHQRETRKHFLQDKVSVAHDESCSAAQSSK